MKRGPFAEHSNQLYNISGVPLWSKVNGGLIKMYKAEVCNRLSWRMFVLLLIATFGPCRRWCNVELFGARWVDIGVVASDSLFGRSVKYLYREMTGANQIVVVSHSWVRLPQTWHSTFGDGTGKCFSGSRRLQSRCHIISSVNTVSCTLAHLYREQDRLTDSAVTVLSYSSVQSRSLV